MKRLWNVRNVSFMKKAALKMLRFTLFVTIGGSIHILVPMEWFF